MVSTKPSEYFVHEQDAQPPARLVGCGGGVLGEPAARTRYAHPNAHDSEEARGEAAAQSATELEGLPADRGRPANRRKRRCSPRAGPNEQLLCSSGHKSA